jgi:hypothetical protein
MRWRNVVAIASAIYLTSCAGGALTPNSYTFPPSVMSDRLSFAVMGGPTPRSFMLNMKFKLSATGEEQKPEQPPTDEQWRKAAEQALPQGCTIKEIKPNEGGDALVTFTC